MRKISTLAAALLGVSEPIHANCFETLKEANFCKPDDSLNYYEICSDLELLEDLTIKYYETDNFEERKSIKQEATKVYGRLKEHGCENILRATFVCSVCTDPDGEQK